MIIIIIIYHHQNHLLTYEEVSPRSTVPFQVYLGSKFCPSVLDNIHGLQVPARYIRDFALFNVWSSSRNCPSARFASDANAACRDMDVFGAKTAFLNHIS
jgi:hypothetical protein